MGEASGGASVYGEKAPGGHGCPCSGHADGSSKLSSEDGGFRHLTYPGLHLQWNRSEPENVVSGWNQSEGDGGAVLLSVHVLGLKPRAKAGIVDLRVAPPEFGIQPALNLQVIQL